VEVTSIEIRDYKPDVQTTGTLVPQRHAVVAALVPGKVVSIPVDIGAKVKKGDTLFIIREADYKAAYNQARANAARAAATARLAQKNKDRMVKLYEQEAASGQEQDQAVAAYKEARAALAQASAARQQAQQSLNDCNVIAQYDGVVTAKVIEEGEFAKEGEEVVEIMDLSALNAELELPERYAGTVSTGLTVKLICRSLSDGTPGKIVAVNPKIDTASRTFKVKVSADNKDGTLQAGLFCTAQFDLPVEKNKMIIPDQAIDRDEGRSTVWVVEDGKAVSRVVTEGGAFDDGKVLILQGLKPDDKVITEGASGLTDGTEVEVKPK